jgi:hypothetical protein
MSLLIPQPREQTIDAVDYPTQGGRISTNHIWDIGARAHRLQRENFRSQAQLLTQSISPVEMLNNLSLPGYRRMTSSICRSDIAYLRWTPLPHAKMSIVYRSALFQATLPIDEAQIGHLGNLLLGRLPEVKLGWQSRRMIDHLCGPNPVRNLHQVAVLFNVPIVCYNVDGSILTVAGEVEASEVVTPCLRVLLHEGYWFRLDRS